MSQQTIRNFKININALNERNTVSSGDVLTGQISFHLNEETEITSLTLRLKGKVHVSWRTRSITNRQTRLAYFDLFNLKSVILQENYAGGGSTRLQPGTLVYPFTCQLPQGNFPSTFNGVYGRINYTLTLSINRPWHMAKDFVTELNYLHRIDVNQPELHAPLSGSNSQTVSCLWRTSGPITMKVSTEKKAFMPGEIVKVICEFSNASSRTATPKVSLQQKQVFYTSNQGCRRMIMKKLASVTGPSICAETSDVHTGILFTIPSDTALTISNCSIIEVDYCIEVSLKVSYASDLTVLIPITLCDTPVEPHPPPYMRV